MRIAALTIGVLTVAFASGCAKQEEKPLPAEPPTTQTGAASVSAPLVQLASLDGVSVEAGCGLCIYGMPGVDGCVPAVVIEGQPLLMTGIEMDLHDHGLCTEAAQAVVSGEVKDGTFVATQFDI